MTASKNRVTLLNTGEAGGDVRVLEAYVAKNGDLVLEGQDLGPKVEEIWGDTDYEYWRTVPAKHVPKVLLQLIKDRFTSDLDFHAWLESKGIPNKFENYV